MLSSQPLSRRRFLSLGAATAGLAADHGCRNADLIHGAPRREGRLFFTTHGRTAIINADGTDLRYLDFSVPDLDEAETRVIALGAVKPDHQPGETWRVYADPAGHPFCLYEEG